MAKPLDREPLLIHFGDMFKVSPEYMPQKFRVVVGLGENQCSTVTVENYGTPEELLNPSGLGSARREYIEQVVENWGLERVLVAYARGHNCDEKWVKAMQETIDESRKQPIILEVFSKPA